MNAGLTMAGLREVRLLVSEEANDFGSRAS